MSKNNPKTEQSKKWLTKALLQLMGEKEYNSITIKEIADRAQLARRTYYRNFNSKDEIISQYCDKICDQYMVKLKEQEDLSLHTASKVLYELWYEHKAFLALLKKNDMLHKLLSTFNEALPKVYKELVGDLSEYKSTEIQKYALLFSAGGYFNILSYSLAHGFDKSPDEIELLMLNVIEAFKASSR
ncbi:MAG: TetR/AcrR family transcriptional regulator [Lachnospiraceae bacterium]